MTKQKKIQKLNSALEFVIVDKIPVVNLTNETLVPEIIRLQKKVDEIIDVINSQLKDK